MRLTPLIALLLGVVFTCLGCDGRRRAESYSRHVEKPDFGYFGMWRVDPEPDELLYIVFWPRGLKQPLPVRQSGLGLRPLSKGISIYPDELYLNGARVPVGDGKRVFVRTQDCKLRPVPLTFEESEALTAGAMGRLEETEAWRKIKAALDKEERRAGYEVPPASVEAPEPNQD